MQAKPARMFSKCCNAGDGLQPTCKKCVSEYMAKYYSKNKERIKKRVRNYRLQNRGLHIQRDKEKYMKHRGGILKRCKAYQAAHPEQVHAKRRLHVALNRGDLTRPAVCEGCGRSDAVIDAHHDDYNKPLDVIWLCRFCHRQHHAASA